MKKSLLALAVLGAFAGAASAQSSVTIYGSLDLGLTKSNGGTSGNNGGAAGNVNGGIDQRKSYTLQSANAPRLGFRGNEDLGGGLSAQFQIEHRYNVDTGTQNNAGTFWQGRSYLQLSHAAAGRIYLGRDYGATFWPAVKSDPFGFDGVGQLGTLMYGSFRSVNPNTAVTRVGTTNAAQVSGLGNNIRVSNSIGYKSPSFAGLTVQIATGLGENVTGRDDSFNVEYGAGPIYAALGYERVKNSGSDPIANAANSRDGDNLINFALHYDFGMVKPMFYYSRSKIDAARTGGLGDVTTKFYSLGALAPIGPGTLKAVVARLDPEGSSNNTRKVGLGYDYPLSKRTNLYADVGITKTDTLTRNTTWSFGAKHTF